MCGCRDGHSVDCPESKKKQQPKQRTIVNNPDPDFEDYMMGEEIVTALTPSQIKTFQPLPKIVKAFLPLNKDSVSAGGIETISIQPHVPSRPRRLWVDEAIASHFSLVKAYVGVADQLVVAYDLRGIPANIFRTGRWPLPPNPDKDLEWGIDLSTWKTIEISHVFSLQVLNHDGLSYHPFRGALEVDTIR